MRTIEEINREINAAVKVRDLARLKTLINELQKDDSVAASASHASALGVLLWMQGDFTDAMTQLDVARDLYQQLGNQLGLAGAINNIGNVNAQTGDYPSALAAFKKTLDIHTAANNRYDMAITAGNIGSIADLMGDPEAALRRYNEALVLFTEIGDQAAIANVLGNIGGVYMRQKESTRALKYLRRALFILKEQGDTQDAARVLGNLVSALLDLGEEDEALDLLSELGSISNMSATTTCMYLRNCSRILENQERLDESRETLNQALEIASSGQLRDAEAAIQLELRENARKRMDMDGYVLHNKEYVRITEELSGTSALLTVAMQAKQRELDEIGHERERERAVLYSTLPRHIANRVIRGEDVSGDHYDAAAVIQFDIVDFTSHSQAIGPHLTTRVLDTVYASFDEICHLHDVTKIKTIGDSYLAVAFPGNGEQGTGNGDLLPELRAANAALGMMGTTHTWPDGSPLQFRAGIHIGPLTAGIIGTQRLQYDVWGETVHVATGMESTSLPGRIQVSSAFADLLLLQRSVAEQLRSSVAVAENDGTANSQPQQRIGTATANSQQQPKLTERGEVSVKGKDTIKTYWLEGA